jgi:type II secretory pathway pseudopilin PulG
MLPRLRDRARRLGAEDEAGFTLVELIVVIGLLITVLAMLLTILDGTQSNLAREITRSSSNDQIRQAVESFDRDVRSGNVLYNPSSEIYNAGCSTVQFPTCGDIAQGQSVRIFTQTNSPTRGGATCVQWRITSGGQLQRRSWLPGATSTTWAVVAYNITNRTDGVQAFSLSGGAEVDLINIDLRANNDPTGKNGLTVEVKSSVSGRNTLQYSNTYPCGPVTPDPTVTTAPAGASLFYKLPNY